ncbi:hypothetical protein GRI97_10175 [Altererythrobacter xixiisoli]|uniref:Uncharacterized protein n=2 Tax=Croceibacterium xixiisoli TaxID=1476466 RepID=A0A6I4TT60_9SPHN|nr:hypothetical protein [Croceibacterium xixiisoli]
MRAYWDDGDRGVASSEAKEVSLAEARLIWSDDVHGVQGHFFGLIDDQDRTIQFYYDAGIPDHVEDARDLPIVWLDFPVPEKRGSYGRMVTVGEVDGLIQTAFAEGLDHRNFGELSFEEW